MKNLIVSFALVLAAGLAPALASGTKEDPRAEEIFAKQFTGAENIKWTRLNNGYLKVAFTLSGIRAEAFFDEDAEFVGAVRGLVYNQLPLAVMYTIDNRFADAAIIEVREVTGNRGTSYRVVLEKKNKKYSLKLNTRGVITALQSEKIKS